MQLDNSLISLTCILFIPVIPEPLSPFQLHLSNHSTVLHALQDHSISA